MSLTLNEIRDRLKQLDEITLMEILDISSEDLVERFQDKIEDRENYFAKDLEDGEDY